MSIVLVRIDNRLIHGQVLESWVPHTHADCIVVASDQAAGNPLQRMLMQASVPSALRVVIGSLEEVAGLLSAGELDSGRVLLLLASAADALELHRRGVAFSELNLGNMHGGEGKARFSCTIALDPSDIADLEALEADGVRIASRCLPSDRAIAWRRLLVGAGDGP
jgi:PTS system mannose-specific IIB component